MYTAATRHHPHQLRVPANQPERWVRWRGDSKMEHCRNSISEAVSQKNLIRNLPGKVGAAPLWHCLRRPADYPVPVEPHPARFGHFCLYLRRTKGGVPRPARITTPRNQKTTNQTAAGRYDMGGGMGSDGRGRNAW